MRRFYLPKEKIAEKIVLDSEQHSHLTKVLRLNEGVEVTIFCADEYDYICQIEKIEKNKTYLILKEKILNTKNPKMNLSLFYALPKGEKIELVTQKINELGASNLYLFESEFSNVKESSIKLDRLNKIALESCKQCGRSVPLNVKLIKFKDINSKLKEFDKVIFAYEKATEKLNVTDISNCNSIAIIVGSEGGFSEKEVEYFEKNDVCPISLGERILRSETACISLVSFANFLLGDKL